jgi:hypothetical protein
MPPTASAGRSSPTAPVRIPNRPVARVSPLAGTRSSQREPRPQEQRPQGGHVTGGERRSVRAPLEERLPGERRLPE